MQKSGVAKAHCSSSLALVRYFYQSWFAIISVDCWTADQRTKIAICPPLVVNKGT
jgi:hypothetical protein